MQDLFRISEVWHDPPPKLRLAAGLIGALLLLEGGGWLFHELIPLEPLHVTGLTRALGAVLLLWLGPWIPSIKTAGRRPALRAAVLALAAGLLGAAALCIRNLVAGAPIFRAGAAPMGLLITAGVSPVTEELFFRGLVYRRIRTRLGPAAAAGLVSGGFAGLHAVFGGPFLLPLAGSLVFCAGYEKDKHILTPILLHISGNLLLGIM